MITLTKLHDPHNEYDIADVTMRLPDDAGLEEMAEAMTGFLKACGYAFKELVVECHEDGE